MCTATDQGQDNPRGQNFDVNRNLLSLRPFATSLKKNSVWFYTIFFMILYMYIAPGQGLTTLGDKILMSTGTSCHFSHRLQVPKNLLGLILYNKCSLAGADSPQGTKFWCQQICLSLHSFVASLKKCLWSLILYNFFFSWFNTYTPGAGAERPQGTKFWCQQKGLITFPICCKFQRNLLSLILYNCFHDLIHVYSAGAGDKILMSKERPYHFTHLLQVSKKSLRSLILYNFVHDLIHVYSPGD